MDYDFSSFNAMLTELSDKIKVPPTLNLSPELLAALDNFSHNPEISSMQEMAKKFQIYCSKSYNPNLTATTISQVASNLLGINMTYDYDAIKGAVSAMASYAENLTSLNTATSGMNSMLSAVSSALGSLDKSATSSEEISDDYIELSEPLADIVRQIDDSIELPVANSQQTVKIEKSNSDLFRKVVAIILAILPILLTVYYHTIDSARSAQEHDEIVQILERIEENTSTDSNSQEPAPITTQSE